MPSPVGAPTGIGYPHLRKSAGIRREESESKNALFSERPRRYVQQPYAEVNSICRLGREPGAHQINVSGTVAISKLT